MKHQALRRRAFASVAVAAALSLSACGTALSHKQIVDAAGGAGAATANDNAAANGDGPNVGGDAATAGGGGSTGAGGNSAGNTGVTSGSAGAAGSGSKGTGGAGAVSGGGCSGTASTVVLGNIGSFSGLAGAALPGAQQAIQAWAQWVNARGGLHCHPVKLVSADDGGDPGRALTLVKQMVEAQGAIGFVANMVPLTLSGIQPYLEQKKIPMVGGDVSLPAWAQSSVIFPSGTDADSFAGAQVVEFSRAGLSKLAILYCGETPSCVHGADYLHSHPTPGVQIAYTAEISIAQTSFTTECLQAQNKGATALYVASDGNSLIRIARDCDQQGYKPRYSAASVAVLPQMASIPSLNGLLALIGDAPWFMTNTLGVQEFRQAMATYAPKAPITTSALAAFASGLIVQKATANLSANPSPNELLGALDALHGETADGLTPPLTFHPGQPSGPIPCYFRITIQNGNWVAPDGANPKCL